MYSMAIELMSMVVMEANRDFLLKKTKKMFSNKGEMDEIKSNEMKLLGRTKEKLTELEYATLKELFYFEKETDGSFGIGIWAFILFESGSDIEEFLKWLDEISSEKYFEYYYFLSTFKKLDTKVTKENILEVLDRDKIKKALKGRILENFYLVDEKLENLRKSIKLVYEKVFIEVEDKIEEKLIEVDKRIGKKIEKSGIESLEIPGVSEGMKLYISYTYIFSLITVEDVSVIGYRLLGAGNRDRFGVGNTLDILKIIGDETRLSIIEMLKGKKYYAKEIVNQLKLAKSTVSYHMEVLMLLGIVEYEKVENKIYYKLNMKKYERLLNELKDKMLKVE